MCLLKVTFYLARLIAECMMIFNKRIDPVRTQMTNKQKMNIS